MELKDAVVVVTGSSSGIGEATARAAAKAGAFVVMLARREARIASLAAELGNALAVPCDVTRPEQVHHAVQSAMEKFGRIDVLVNNAGQGLHGEIEDIGVDDFRALLDLNLVAPLILMQAVIPIMRRQGAGSIVNVSSGATLATYPGSAAYTSSKSGLNMLSNVARLELADSGILISLVHPFVTATEFYSAVKSGAEPARAQEADMASFAHKPDLVGDMILDLIRTGAAEADLLPVAYGGSFKG